MQLGGTVPTITHPPAARCTRRQAPPRHPAPRVVEHELVDSPVNASKSDSGGSAGCRGYAWSTKLCRSSPVRPTAAPSYSACARRPPLLASRAARLLSAACPAWCRHPTAPAAPAIGMTTAPATFSTAGRAAASSAACTGRRVPREDTRQREVLERAIVRTRSRRRKVPARATGSRRDHLGEEVRSVAGLGRDVAVQAPADGAPRVAREAVDVDGLVVRRVGRLISPRQNAATPLHRGVTVVPFIHGSCERCAPVRASHLGERDLVEHEVRLDQNDRLVDGLPSKPEAVECWCAGSTSWDVVTLDPRAPLAQVVLNAVGLVPRRRQGAELRSGPACAEAVLESARRQVHKALGRRSVMGPAGFPCPLQAAGPWRVAQIVRAEIAHAESLLDGVLGQMMHPRWGPNKASGWSDAHRLDFPWGEARREGRSDW